MAIVCDNIFLVIGSEFSHYRVLEKLGQGGMGVVYLAEDLNLRRNVALKLLSDRIRDEDAVERFTREARAAAAISHPNICTVYEVGEYKQSPFIAMELLEGETLERKITHGRLPLSTILDWASQITEALDAAHSHGIIHRDLKPANLFVTKRGQLKILDFGVAKLKPQENKAARGTMQSTLLALQTDPGQVIGTPVYMSPEQARGDPVDLRSDLFSLGVVLYQMATGVLPFEATSAAASIASILRDSPKTPSSLNPGLPAQFDRIVSKALEKDRDMRYQSASDLRADLKRIQRDTDSKRTELPAEAAQPAVSKLPKRQRWAVFLFAFGAVIAALFWFRVISRHSEAAVGSPEIVPFTSLPGKQLSPAFSPDGNQIAFAWKGAADADQQIYVKLIGSDAPLRLTSSSNYHGFPVWSPNGRDIAFLRWGEDAPGIYVVPSLVL